MIRIFMISLKIAMRQNSIQIQMIYFKFENSISLEVMRKKKKNISSVGKCLIVLGIFHFSFQIQSLFL